jgi:hypothetical protein
VAFLSKDAAMLHYVLEARTEPFAWHDVEALPLYLGAVLVAVGAHHLALELAPELRWALLKAVVVVVLLAIRQVLGGGAGEEDGGVPA